MTKTEILTCTCVHVQVSLPEFTLSLSKGSLRMTQRNLQTHPSDIFDALGHFYVIPATFNPSCKMAFTLSLCRVSV